MLEIIIKKYKNFLEKLNERDKRLLLIIIFLFNLSIYSIPLYIYSYNKIVPNYFLYDYTDFISQILNIINIKHYVEYNNIYVNNLNFQIDQQCIGFKGVLGLFAIIFATPIFNYKKKLYYFIISGIIIYILNIVRIVSVILSYYFLKLSYQQTLFIHNVLWEILTTISILILWLPFYIKNKKYLFIYNLS